MKRVVGLGAGGHAKVVIDSLRRDGGWELIGLLDPDASRGEVLGVPVLGDDSLLPELDATHAFIGVGATSDTSARRRLFELAVAHGLEPVTAIHPSAVVAESARIGAGVTIMANAVVNADATLGVNVVVNTGAIVEHDCVVDDHAHVATAAALGGGVHVGEGAHVGLGARVNQCLHIGRGAVVGSGAVVVDDVPDGITVVGIPARPLR